MTISFEPITARSIVKCSRCKRRARVGKSHGWNIETKGGYVIAHLCPSCQTPEENAEAEIREATLDYTGLNAFGQLTARPKVVAR